MRNGLFAWFQSICPENITLYKGQNNTITVGKAGKHNMNQLINVNVISNGTKMNHWQPDKIQWEDSIASMLFFPTVYSLDLIIRKHETCPRKGQNNWPLIFKRVKFIKTLCKWDSCRLHRPWVIKVKGKMKNSSRIWKTGKTTMILNWVVFSNRHYGDNWKTWMSSKDLVVVMYTH